MDTTKFKGCSWWAEVERRIESISNFSWFKPTGVDRPNRTICYGRSVQSSIAAAENVANLIDPSWRKHADAGIQNFFQGATPHGKLEWNEIYEEAYKRAEMASDDAIRDLYLASQEDSLPPSAWMEKEIRWNHLVVATHFLPHHVAQWCAAPAIIGKHPMVPLTAFAQAWSDGYIPIAYLRGKLYAASAIPAPLKSRGKSFPPFYGDAYEGYYDE